jgi:hypothetical protein
VYILDAGTDVATARSLTDVSSATTISSRNCNKNKDLPYGRGIQHEQTCPHVVRSVCVYKLHLHTQTFIYIITMHHILVNATCEAHTLYVLVQ